MYQAGPFPFGNTVKVFVTNEQDNNCVISSPFFEVLACPPANDECSGAITAVVNDDGSCDMLTPGTILAATTSNVPSGSCTGDTDDDVWFEFTALSEVQDQLKRLPNALYWDILLHTFGTKPINHL